MNSLYGYWRSWCCSFGFHRATWIGDPPSYPWTCRDCYRNVDASRMMWARQQRKKR